MKLIDVSVPLDANSPTYPGNTPFSLEAIKRLARGDSSNVSSAAHERACRHTRRRAAAFFRRRRGRRGAAARNALRPRPGDRADDTPGRSPRTTWRPSICSEDVRVLIKTHNSRLWGSPEFHADFIGVTEAGGAISRRSRRQGARRRLPVGRGIQETWRAGAPRAPRRAARSSSKALNLRDVEPGIYEMFCLPLAIVGSDGAPARVVLRRS